jgi:hypothetical protein
LTKINSKRAKWIYCFKMSTRKAIGHAFGASVAASLAVLLIGACIFGFQLDRWAKWQGGLIGVIGTIAGIAGAVIGLRIALRTERRANK